MVLNYMANLRLRTLDHNTCFFFRYRGDQEKLKNFGANILSSLSDNSVLIETDKGVELCNVGDVVAKDLHNNNFAVFAIDQSAEIEEEANTVRPR